jgi:uncharacterized protein YcgI (DUF1989 family)
MERIRIPSAHACSFALDAGERFTIVDPEGQQVSDVTAFALDDRTERFSSKYTHARVGRLRLSTGDSLYTTRGNPILTITEDDCGTHDILHGPGTSWLLSELEGRDTSVRACHENLIAVLEDRGVSADQLFDVMNVFMKSTVTDQRYVDVRLPESEPGDSIEFEADRPALVGVTACASKSVTNAGAATSIDTVVPETAELATNFDLS